MRQATPTTGIPDLLAGGPAYTVAEIATLYRVKQHVVLAWIRAGELRADNVATPGARKPRWKILPSELAAFRSLRASVAIESPRRQKLKRPPSAIDPATGKINRAALLA